MMQKMPTRPPLAPGALPLVGHAASFLRDPVAVMRSGQRAHGPVFSIRLGPKRAAVVVGVEESRAALALPESTLAVRPVYQWLRPMFGEVMQAAAPSDYLTQRAALLPAFRGRQVSDQVMSVAQDVHAWTMALGSSGRFDANRDVERLTLDIAIGLVLGTDFRVRHGEEFRALLLDVAAGMDFFLPERFPAPRLIRRNRARRALFAMLSSELNAARTEPDPERRGYFGHIALSQDESGASFDEDTAIGLALILCYASYETTAAQLAWVLVLLLQHPTHYKRVLDEVCTRLPDRQDLPTLTDLRRLDLLGACLLETQRLRPATSMLTRFVAEPVTVGGYEIPRGWNTLFCPPVTHRLPDLYPSPDIFDPERFSSERDLDGRAAGQLLNLGAGVHACLGGHVADIEMRLVVTLLLRRFEMKLVDPSPAPTTKPGVSRPAGPCLIEYRSHSHV
ncbi:cytochrome P450 [Streptomyces uncialis]|uniref:cytochrome P450 n=2 Tax=Streptomyces uncialis TaxID=1048205 RepID=UPI0037A0BEBD